MAERKRLSDILLNTEKDRLERTWSTVKAADDFRPIPAGEYRARVLNGELFDSNSGTPGFKITLEVLDGEFAGRRVWHDVWLSEAAISTAKRDLAKFGIERIEQLERPLPEGIIVSARIALRRNDDGSESNKVVRFDVVAVEPPGPEPFAPPEVDQDAESLDAQGFDWRRGPGSEGETI